MLRIVKIYLNFTIKKVLCSTSSLLYYCKSLSDKSLVCFIKSNGLSSHYFSIPISVVKKSLIINFVMKQLCFHYKLPTWENYKGKNKNLNYKLKLQSKQQTFTTCLTAQLQISKMNAGTLCIPTNSSAFSTTAAINVEFVPVISARL